MTIEWKLWGGVMHMGGTEFSIGSCIPSKYINQGKPSGSSFHQKLLPYRPNHFSLTIHSGFHGLGPWVSKIIPNFAGFFNDFFAGNLNIHLGFPIFQPMSSSQGFKGHIKVLGPWCSSCCISSGLTEVLAACLLVWPSLGPLLLFIYLLLFLSFSFFLGL